MIKLRAGDKITVELTEPMARHFVKTGNIVIAAKHVIEHIPAAFDWSDVKPGHEYITQGNYAEYIGFSKAQRKHVFWLKGCCEFLACDEHQRVDLSDRTKDIEVK